MPLSWLCSVGVRERESESERFFSQHSSLPALLLPSVATGCSATPPTFPLQGAAAGSPSPAPLPTPPPLAQQLKLLVLCLKRIPPNSRTHFILT